MQDPRDNRVYTDENGTQWLADSDGKAATDESGNKIPPTQAEYTIDPKSGWRDYDSSRGHCGLCGNLYCRGGCFK